LIPEVNSNQRSGFDHRRDTGRTALFSRPRRDDFTPASLALKQMLEGVSSRRPVGSPPDLPSETCSLFPQTFRTQAAANYSRCSDRSPGTRSGRARAVGVPLPQLVTHASLPHANLGVARCFMNLRAGRETDVTSKPSRRAPGRHYPAAPERRLAGANRLSQRKTVTESLPPALQAFFLLRLLSYNPCSARNPCTCSSCPS
jgi:hypothetical protein